MPQPAGSAGIACRPAQMRADPGHDQPIDWTGLNVRMGDLFHGRDQAQQPLALASAGPPRLKPFLRSFLKPLGHCLFLSDKPAPTAEIDAGTGKRAGKKFERM